MYGGQDTLREVTPLRKMSLPTQLVLRGEEEANLLDRMLLGLILCMSCAGSHSCCSLKSTTVGSHGRLVLHPRK